jgi:hypothetical protein
MRAPAPKLGSHRSPFSVLFQPVGCKLQPKVPDPSRPLARSRSHRIASGSRASASAIHLDSRLHRVEANRQAC